MNAIYEPRGEAPVATEACLRCSEPKLADSSYCRDCAAALLILRELERHHVGAGAAMSREALMKLTGLTDRHNRAIIAERLRDYGEPICALQRAPGGYYYAATEDDWDELMRLFTSRAMTCLQRRRRLRERRAERRSKVEQRPAACYVGPQGCLFE